MTGAEATSEMFVSMLLGTGVLIGTVVFLVVAGIVVYHHSARDGQETEDFH